MTKKEFQNKINNGILKHTPVSVVIDEDNNFVLSAVHEYVESANLGLSDKFFTDFNKVVEDLKMPPAKFNNTKTIFWFPQLTFTD